MIVFPNAKINIGLNILEKRNDDFHNIESIFYPVHQLYDVLEVVKSDALEFNSSGISIPGDADSNLCLKAYELLKKDFDISGVKIHLHKVIPIGAGLGGGSSDAAFMLKALNELFELTLNDEQLVAYARLLGSDCAFFIKNIPVYAYNKGDEFEPIALDLSTNQIKVVYPNIHISTKEAYSGVQPQPSTTDLRKLIEQPLAHWQETIKNDFQFGLIKTHPIIQTEIEKMIQKGAKFAAMTGSGSAVYGIF